MQKKKKILILEHDPSDVELIQYELAKSDIQYETIEVQNEVDFRKALKNFDPDIILSDYSVPSFDGLTAFKVKEIVAPEIPFIIVSGAVGDERAVELIRSGVTDYVLKDKLFTLTSKIIRALNEAEVIKEKRATEDKLVKATNLYAFISQVNQNIVRVKDQASLFRNSCQMAIEFGKFKMSWIGLFDCEYEKISLIEQCGLNVEDLALFSEAHCQKGGPQNIVLNSGQYFICNDIQQELSLANWKSFALKHGINSCLVMPIKKSGVIIGTFNLYSESLNFSEAQEIKLLLEVTNDISFALDLFDNEKKHKKISELLVINEKKLRNTLDTMLEGISIFDFNFKFLYVNDVFVESCTYKREELIGYTLMERYSAIEHTDFYKALERCLREKSNQHIETTFVFPDGNKVDLELSMVPIPEGATVFSIDKTEQNKAKKKLHSANRLYAFISAINQSIVHLRDEQTLLNNACKIAIEIGKYKMSWIKLIDEKDGKLNIVSISGPQTAVCELLETSGIKHKDPVLIGTPTGMVLATGNYSANNDMQNDPAIFPWKKFLVKNDIKSGMALPLMKFGKLVGVFGFYSADENVFDAEEIALLQEASGDISFALENFEKAKRHQITEELVLRNEKRFRALVEQGSDAFAIFSSNGEVLYVSPSVQRILGYTEGEAMRLDIFSLVHPDDVAGLAKIWERVLVSPGVAVPGYTGRLKHKNGTWRWLEAVATNMMHDSAINGIVDNFRDVTEKIEAELQKEFDKYNLDALINNTTDLMWSVDRDFNLITCNRPFDEMSKLNFGRVIARGENILNISYSLKMRTHFKQIYERAFSGEAFTETSYFDFPAEIWSEIFYYPIRKGNQIIGTACHSRDITPAKLAERKLKKSEAFNTGILNSLTSHIAVIDLSGTIIAVNESWKRFAIENGDVTNLSTCEGANYFTVCENATKNKSEEAFDVAQGIKDVMLGKRSGYYIEYPCHSPTIKRWFGMRAVKFESDELMVVVAHQNITERKLAEEKLIHSESRLKEAQSISHIGNWEFDYTKNTHTWSDELFVIFGVDKQLVIPSTELFLSLMHPEDKQEITTLVMESLKSLNATSYNFRFIRSDGVLRHGYTERKFEFDENQKPVRLLGVVQDITDRVSANEEREKMISNILQHSKNLEQFASIVSHNLRAPVAHILGLANVLKGDISQDDRARGQQYLFTATESLDEIVTDLNIILKVRSDINEYKETVYFEELVNSVKSSIQNVIENEAVQIITDFSAVDKIISIKSYIHSIFHNLISNGIKYRKEDIPNVISIRTFLNRDKITIVFTDNGIGIDLIKYGDQLFGLYKRFHLKIEGKGLGLFMIKTQIETLGGTINITSKPGEGAEFTIELPVEEAKFQHLNTDLNIKQL